MMVNPQSYANKLKDLSYEELITRRNQLIDDLHKFETGNITDRERMKRPSPEVVYQHKNLYLIKVTKLLSEKFNKSPKNTD